MAIGAAPFGEMSSPADVLRRAKTLIPDASRHEPDQHVVSWVILKKFAELRSRRAKLYSQASTSGARKGSPFEAGQNGSARFMTTVNGA
jgi:hypothetical protein